MSPVSHFLMRAYMRGILNMIGNGHSGNGLPS